MTVVVSRAPFRVSLESHHHDLPLSPLSRILVPALEVTLDPHIYGGAVMPGPYTTISLWTVLISYEIQVGMLCIHHQPPEHLWWSMGKVLQIYELGCNHCLCNIPSATRRTCLLIQDKITRRFRFRSDQKNIRFRGCCPRDVYPKRTASASINKTSQCASSMSRCSLRLEMRFYSSPLNVVMKHGGPWWVVSSFSPMMFKQLWTALH